MTKFIPGQSATVSHEAIKSSLKTRDKAQQCAVLWFEEILNRKLYRELGYSSINQYAKVELGFSKSHTGEFLALCRTFIRLPKLKEKVASGELPYTSARVLSPVMDENNQDEWLASAENKSRRELEKEVKLARLDAVDKLVGQASLLPQHARKRPAAVVPVRVNMEMSPTQFARYEKLWEQIRKQNNVASDRVEALLEVLDSYVSGDNEATQRSARADLSMGTKPPVQIHIHQCPDCAKAAIQTSKGELEIGEAELARAQCDCQTSEPQKRNTTSILPALRRSVLANARHKCQNPGCQHTRFLEVHHIIARKDGGSNELPNLMVLCSGCHKIHHEYKIPPVGLKVKSPVEMYSWRPLRTTYFT